MRRIDWYRGRRGGGKVPADRPGGFCPELFTRFARDHLGLVLLVALPCLVAVVLDAQGPLSHAFRPFENLRDIALACASVFVPLHFARCFSRTVRARPPHPLRDFLCRSCRIAGNGRTLADGVAILLLFVVFANAFAYLKGSISLGIGFGWDRAFAALDHALFGIDPWRLTFALFGTPLGTAGLTVIYALWYVLLVTFVCTLAFQRGQPHLRLSFFYGFFLVWTIGGLILAALFSSAGPAFYAALGAGDRYGEQMAMLRAFHAAYPVWALDTQDALWLAFQRLEAPSGGISAMPSMNVAFSVYLALVAFRIDRRLGRALAVFAIFIGVASVHLGWHYAVDGILGAAVALACNRMAIALAALDLGRAAPGARAIGGPASSTA